MSLVQAYIFKDFILVGGEERAIFNNRISENYRKVYKLNKYTIIGFTGSISGNACLFGDYINPDFSFSKLCYNSSYNDIVTHLTEVFNMNYNFLSADEYGIHSFVCGWDGSKMTGKSFFVNDENPILNGINDLTPENDNSLRVANCGLDMHFKNAKKFLYGLDDKMNILRAKTIFKNVINEGVKFDNTINANITFEKIKLGDTEIR